MLQDFVKENWGSPFIVAFMVLLAGAAFLLYAGLPYQANTIASYAFCAIVVGFVLQFVGFLRQKKVEASLGSINGRS